MRLPATLLLLAGAASAAAARADCPPLPVAALLERVAALSPATDGMRLVAFRLQDTDPDGAETARHPEAIVLIEEIARGGADSLMLIEVYPGREGGLCDAPATLQLEMDPAAPYALEPFPTDRPGRPGLDIRYRFFASNAFGTYDTDSTYVTDERRERYLPAGDGYALSAREIIECIVCAPRRGAD